MSSRDTTSDATTLDAHPTTGIRWRHMRQQEVEARTYRLDSILEPGDITLTCGSCGYEWIADAEEVTRKVGCLEAMCPACETVNRMRFLWMVGAALT